MGKTALITGITGQDGSYLAEYLLLLGYTVYGMVRRVSHPNTDITDPLVAKGLILVEGDLSDAGSIGKLLLQVKPDELYNLAAQSHVATSFNQPTYTSDVTGLGVLRVLDQVRLYSPYTKVYQAGSSEMYGDVQVIPQDEHTEFRPRSPYAAAKVFGHHIGKVYRESYGLYVCNGILFNHESPRRGLNFVTRKITDYIGRYKAGLVNEPLQLGYLDAKRDWGSAKDYVVGMHMMLQQPTADDYILSTGETHSVREFAELAFKRAGYDLFWKGEGVEEIGCYSYEYEPNERCTVGPVIKINPEFYRPAEVPILIGDATKARKAFGWEPSMKFDELVNWMVDSDIERYKTHVSSTN